MERSFSEDGAVTLTTQPVPLAHRELSIEPRDGDYENGAGASLMVSGGYVVSFMLWLRPRAVKRVGGRRPWRGFVGRA
jgi:hypothetical protein